MANLDLYLGSFLILSGFVLSLFNLRRIIKSNKVTYPAVLLSENILLTCIGIAFMGRSLYKFSPISMGMQTIEERSSDMKNEEINCSFVSIIMSYGPLIISLANSFLSLIIDNYMHYKLLLQVKKDEVDNEVREINSTEDRIRFKDFYSLVKKYYTLITVLVQWILPILIALPMYSMNTREMIVRNDQRSFGNKCMALLDAQKDNCSLLLISNETLEVREYSPQNYLAVNDIDPYNNMTDRKQLNNVIDNVYKILANLQNESYHSDINVTATVAFREPKIYVNQKCMKICYLENQHLVLYMFGVAVVSYFVPITISTIILTKIHIMKVKNQSVKPYVSRELLYNILFWTPIMFDTFLSITLCSYTMDGMRTSIFNVIANVYQAVKNFMNTKYFKDNTIVPV